MDTLVPHRLLPLSHGQLAILSEQSNAWCVVPEEAYSLIKERIGSTRGIPSQLRSDLRKSGLLEEDGVSVVESEPAQGPSSLLLKVTGACNINCGYCYDHDLKRWKARLSFDKVRETIDELMSHRATLGIVFHGGEPLLRFDLIQEVVQYVRSNWTEKKAMRFQIQTNGHLLNEAVIGFLREYDFSVGISLDGHTNEANRLRLGHDGSNSWPHFERLLQKHADFLRERCGVLAVVSQANISTLPDFALWLQSIGVNNLSLSFLDAAGKAANLAHERVSAAQAIGLFEEYVDLIRKERLWDLKLAPLTSRISNLHQFRAQDFCHKGPCAAANEFLVLDAEEKFRTCDCVYDDFFVIGDAMNDDFIARRNIHERHAWLKTNGIHCATCSLWSLCGGTCPAKAIASNGNPFTIDSIECAVAKYLFPELLNEFASGTETSLFRYYDRHVSHGGG